MSKIILPDMEPESPSRRRFVLGLSAGTALLGVGLSVNAKPSSETMRKILAGPVTLKGSTFNLAYSPVKINLTGSERIATAINNSVPAPILRWKEGDTVTLNVTNNMAVDTSIHWHGIILPPEQDGVPGISFDGIKPGTTHKYQFKVNQSGTYWYHSHSGFQEQTGAYGAIVIEPKEPPPYSYDRDYVVMLSDWSDEDPNDVYKKLKKLSHYYNFRERTITDAMKEVSEGGWKNFWSTRGMWNDMRMSDRDISDVTGYTYTFLTNGQTPDTGWTGLFKKGEKVLLRFINSAAMTFFDVRIPGLKMTVVASDGQYIQPVSVDEFRIGVAETYDVIVEPSAERAYSIFSQAIDRSGYARGTLTPNVEMIAEVPELDAAPLLTHGDMGMDMSSMSGMDHSGHDMGAINDSKMSGKKLPEMKCGGNMKMDSGMDHSGHNMGGMTAASTAMGSGKAGYGSKSVIAHAESEFGPHVDMRSEAPQYRLDDPGVGLRNNGRKVLTYADLRNFNKTPDPREPSREINLHLTGNMSRYMWSINGIKFADSEPLMLKYGERVRINLINDTMMNHPMHLHGMWSDLETGDPHYIPRKHTAIVQPGSRISYLVTADAKGSWAYHCHLIYHMLGMFRKVTVS